MNITHTSETEQGQIYVGQINWMILAGVVLLVLVFKSSTNLASAYGMAVNTSMVVDTILAPGLLLEGPEPAALVCRSRPCSASSSIELTFLAANGLKLATWRLHAGAASAPPSSC